MYRLIKKLKVYNHETIVKKEVTMKPTSSILKAFIKCYKNSYTMLKSPSLALCFYLVAGYFYGSVFIGEILKDSPRTFFKSFGGRLKAATVVTLVKIFWEAD